MLAKVLVAIGAFIPTGTEAQIGPINPCSFPSGSPVVGELDPNKYLLNQSGRGGNCFTTQKLSHQYGGDVQGVRNLNFSSCTSDGTSEFTISYDYLGASNFCIAAVKLTGLAGSCTLSNGDAENLSASTSSNNIHYFSTKCTTSTGIKITNIQNELKLSCDFIIVNPVTFEAYGYKM